MQKFSFGVSSLLASSGVALAVVGIMQGEFKPVAIGLVLIFGAGVFATLFLGSRVMNRRRDESEAS